MGWLYLTLSLIAQAYFPLAVTIALLLAATPQIDPRFRVPMIPLLVFMAMLQRPGRQADSDGQKADPAQAR